MKTIKILNNTIYSIKFSLNYKNNTEVLNSNYIYSMYSSSLTIPDTAENIEINVYILNNLNKLIKTKSFNLAKASDKYYEFIGSETNSTLIELIKYKEIDNIYKISFLNKTTTHIVKVQFECLLYVNSTPFSFTEVMDLTKNFQYISFPIAINNISHLKFIISLAKKNSSTLPEFKKVKQFTFTKNKLKLCYELSRKGLNLGIYENNMCL